MNIRLHQEDRNRDHDDDDDLVLEKDMDMDMDIDNETVGPYLLLRRRHLPNRHYSFVNAIGEADDTYSIEDIRWSFFAESDDISLVEVVAADN